MISNHPPVLIEITPELAQSVIDNCESNLHFGLIGIGMTKDRGTLEKLVANIENFKALLLATRKDVDNQ